VIGDWCGLSLVGQGSRKTEPLTKGRLPALEQPLNEANRGAERWPMTDHGSARFRYVAC
jgi:hypothetical protein